MFTIKFYVTFCAVLAGMNLWVAGTTDTFAECLRDEVCDTEDGMTRIKSCFSELGENDWHIAESFFREFWEIPDMDCDQLIQYSCSDTEKAKKGVNDYYDNRQKDESADKLTPEDEQKLAECRKCMMSMINECQLKKQLV